MNNQKSITISLMAFMAIAMALCACEKSSKTSSAGGGSSTQSVMTLRGATR